MTSDRPKVIFHEDFLKHDTGPGHPESPERLVAIRARLKKAGFWEEAGLVAPRAATVEELLLVHQEAYVRWVEHVARVGQGPSEAEVVISSRSFEVAALAAGAGLVGADLLASGKARCVFCCVRPPGHHATASRAMGFCLFNNVAIAARYLQRRYGLRRLAIVDWDVHHGNGTQDIFYDDAGVFFFSMHRFPFYPGSGAAEERGEGKGEGFTLNVPVAPGTLPEEYLELYRRGVRKIAREYRPEMVLVSAGFDAYHDDPIGDLGLRPMDYGEMTRCLVKEMADSGGGRVLSVLEGGYNPPALAECVEEHLRAMSDGR